MIPSLREMGQRYPGLASIGRNTAHYVTGEWAEVLLRAVYALAISRFLGPADYGWWSYGFAVSAICITFSGMGTDMVLSQRLGRGGRDVLALVETSFTVRLVVLAGLAALLAIYAVAGAGETTEKLVLLLLLPTVLFRGLSSWLRLAAIGFEQADLAMRPMVLVRAAELVLGLTLVMSGASLFTLLALHGISWLVEVAIITPRIRRLAPFGLRIHRAEAREVVKKGSAIGLATALGFLLFGLPLVLLKHFAADIDTVGQFGLAMQLAMFAVMALLGVGVAAQVVLTRAVAREDSRAPLFGHVFLLGCLLLAGPTWLGATWLGTPVITALLGQQYALAGALLPACLMLAIAASMGNGYWQMLVLRDRIAAGGVANALAVALMLALAGGLVEQYGAIGAAYAAIAGGLLRTVLLGLLATVLPTDQKST